MSTDTTATDILQSNNQLLLCYLTNKRNTLFNNNVDALHLNTGSLAWSFSSGSSLYMLSIDGTISVVNWRNSTLVWQHSLGNAYTQLMFFTNNILLLVALNGDYDLLNPNDGAIIQGYHTPIPLSDSFVSGKYVYGTFSTEVPTESIGIYAFETLTQV